MRTADDHAPSCRVRLEPVRHDELHPELDDWRANVGAPVAVDCEAAVPAAVEGVDVLSWNAAIGMGRLAEVIERLRDAAPGAAGAVGQRPERPLVVLLQEAYRSDASVPDSAASRHHGGLAPRADRTDVVQVARELGMSLRYSPSMRNGDHSSDRGNAILSTVRLEGARALLLPHVRQRRVAVMAQLHGVPQLTFVSAHLDTHGQPRRERSARFRLGTGRVVQAQALAAALAEQPGSVVLGADLNTVFGVSDPVIRTLVAAGMHPARRVGNWRYTFRSPLRLLLDHVLYMSGDGRIVHAEVTRLDPEPRLRTRRVFGSDHHPLLARVELAGS
jgi:endonuclease/exonuclease/phosphatase family metal-dependent hydrolase